jgi:hypothetical protein
MRNLKSGLLMFFTMLISVGFTSVSNAQHFSDSIHGRFETMFHNQCEVELTGRNRPQQILHAFVDYGHTRREACDNAAGQCERYIQFGGAQNARNLICTVKIPIVTRTCSAQIQRPNGALAGNFVGTATGPFNSGVEDQACRQAMRSCLAHLSTLPYSPRTVCIDEQGNSQFAAAPGRPVVISPVPPRPVPSRPVRR